jgi:hypothetical protein
LSSLIVAALTCVTLAACDRDESSVTTEVNADDGGDLALDGVRVHIPPHALRKSATLKIAPVRPKLPTDVSNLSSSVRVELDGEALTAPATITFPLSAAPSRDHLVYALRQDDDGRLVNAGGAVDATARTLTVSTTHFSVWSVVQHVLSVVSGVAKVVRSLQNAWKDLRWRPTDPDCGPETSLWWPSVVGGDGIRLCGQEDRDGQPTVLKVVNARLYPQFLKLREYGLRLHEPVPAVDVSGATIPQPPGAGQDATQTPDAFGNAVWKALSAFDSNLTILPGKGTATVELPADAGGVIGGPTIGARLEPSALAMAYTVIVDVLATAFVPVNYLVNTLDCIRRNPDALHWNAKAVDAWVACASAVATGMEGLGPDNATPQVPEEGDSRVPTARCADGSLSYATTSRGRCSHHGGVARELDSSGKAGGLAATAEKLLEGLSAGLKDAPAVLDLLTRGAVQGPNSLQAVAQPRPFIATGALGENFDFGDKVRQTVEGLHVAAAHYDYDATYRNDGHSPLHALIPPAGLAFSNAADPDQRQTLQLGEAPDKLAGPQAAAALAALTTTAPRLMTCPETGQRAYIYGADAPGPALDAALAAAHYSPQVRAAVVRSTRAAAGYRICVASDGAWRSFYRDSGGPSTDPTSPDLPVDDDLPDALPADAFPPVPGISPVNSVGYLTGISTAAQPTISFDRVTWHWCTPAESATAPPGQCANDYRITNENARIRTYPLQASTKIVVWTESNSYRTITLDELRRTLAKREQLLVVLSITKQGTVVGIGEPFRP